MGEIIRLFPPKDEPRAGLCPECQRDLNDLRLDEIEVIATMTQLQIVRAITYEVQCECGQLVGIRLRIKR